MLNQPKSRAIAIILALAGIIIPGLHKFYLGEYRWGIIYLLLSWTPIPKVASAIEAVWYLAQDEKQFSLYFNYNINSSVGIEPNQVGAIASALRQLDQLREEGLISEYEFEQKRRQWLDRMI
jgi:TM2 domain-containing membrane protein YozV